MYNKQNDTFMNGVKHALALPLRQRCEQLACLLDKANIVELHKFFPLLVDEIFGAYSGRSWGLRSIYEGDFDTFRSLKNFLSPTGSLFRLIYTLLKEPGIKYEFARTMLPLKIQQIIETSQSHTFYSELIQLNYQSREGANLLLNPFDYYMFHFAYHLTNKWHQSCVNVRQDWNSVYYELSVDYMRHFLPAEVGIVIQPVIQYVGKNAPPAIQQNTRPSRGLGLIAAPAISSVDETLHRNLENHPRHEIWRSETVLTVFIDMWLYNDQVVQQHNHLGGALNESLQKMPLLNELPTKDFLRIVRVLIKQIHMFSLSSKIDNSHLCELKKIAVPMLQEKLYIFLRNLIHKWPLDGTFRLVLEVWLTYIQPWRYDILKPVKLEGDLCPQTVVDKDHLPFIAENLLVYVVILQQLLPRFTRVDLISPTMSLMLYRITKVFVQTNLSDYLREIESCVENNHSPTHHNHWTKNLPPLSPTTNWSSNTTGEAAPMRRRDRSSFAPTINSTAILNATTLQLDKKWVNVVRQKIFDLEGPSFCYKPLFVCDSSAPEVCELVFQIRKNMPLANELVRKRELEEQRFSGFSGFWHSLMAVQSETDEFSLVDRRKVPLYLNRSLLNLCQLFQIHEIFEREAAEHSSGSPSSSFDFGADLRFLTPEKVRHRIKNIRYEGDPDLHPIRSYENTFLVRNLYKVAQTVNRQYGQLFYRLYHAQTFHGKLAREFLCPPMTIYRYDKSLPGSPRVSSNLPPRVSFRTFANYSLIVYLVVGAALFKLLGYGVVFYVFFLGFVLLLYKLARAMRSGCANHVYPTQGFGNISFNDSF